MDAFNKKLHAAQGNLVGGFQLDLEQWNLMSTSFNILDRQDLEDKIGFDDSTCCQAYAWKDFTKLNMPAVEGWSKNKCGFVTQCPSKKKDGDFCKAHAKKHDWGVVGDSVNIVTDFSGQDHLVRNNPETHTWRTDAELSEVEPPKRKSGSKARADSKAEKDQMAAQIQELFAQLAVMEAEKEARPDKVVEEVEVQHTPENPELDDTLEFPPADSQSDEEVEVQHTPENPVKKKKKKKAKGDKKAKADTAKAAKSIVKVD